MAYETILFNKEDSVRIITLNRPNCLNAINYRMAIEIEEVLEEIEDDSGARSVIVIGAGRGFCAGADINEMLNPNARHFPRGKGYGFFKKLEDLAKPTIAAINGPCNGGGLELAICCDFRIASQTANFGLGEVKLGTIPGRGGTARLPRLIGPGRAKEFLYFGNLIDASEAVNIGLINKVVTAEKLMEETQKWAIELAERAPLSLKMLKHCVNIGMQMNLLEALEYEAKCSALLMNTEDHREGVSAFVERRKPCFKGQ